MLTLCNDSPLHYYQMCNGIQHHFRNSYCNRNHVKWLKKIKELKEKGDPEWLHISQEDLLVGMPSICRFECGKSMLKNKKMHIVQKQVACGAKVIFSNFAAI